MGVFVSGDFQNAGFWNVVSGFLKIMTLYG